MTSRLPWPARLAPSRTLHAGADSTVWSSTLDVVPTGGELLVSGTAQRRDGTEPTPDPARLHVVLAGQPVTVREARGGLGAADGPLGHLVGLSVQRGFRKRAAAATRDTGLPPADQVLLAGLLDDVAIAPILARAAMTPLDARADLDEPFAAPVDMCSGFRRGGHLVTLTTKRGSGRLGIGPAADPAPNAAPAVGSARRERRVVVDGPAASSHVRIWFRDTVGEPDGASVVHEYRAELELDDGVIVRAGATPVVMPGPDCAPAAASAARLNGIELGAVGDVLTSGAGPSTCPHLDDMLRPVRQLIARSL